MTGCLFSMSSCADMVSYRKAVDAYGNSTPCCTSISEFKCEQWSSEKSKTYRIDANSDSFRFISGKSYFLSFRLPDKKIPYRIHVKSFALGETIDKAHIFYPQLALWDDGFTVLKQSSPNDFVFKKAGFEETMSSSWGLMIKFEGSMVVDMPDASYLLVYTTEELLRKTSPYVAQRTMPIIFPGLVGALPWGKEIVKIPCSPFGLIYLAAEDDMVQP